MSRNVSLFFSCLKKWMQDELQVVLGVGVGQKRSLQIYVYFFFFLRNFVVISTVSAFLENSRNIVTLLFVVVVVVETMIRIQKLG